MSESKWWLDYSPLILGSLGFLGAIINGLFTYHASRRDKATANTITELRTIIERLSLDLTRARQAENDCRAATEETERQKHIAEERAKIAEAELVRHREFITFGTWLVVAHDPIPRVPICPSCHANGKVSRMRQYTMDVDGKVRNGFECTERQCRIHLIIRDDEAEKLFEILGDRGCYNDGPAKSLKPQPRQRGRPYLY